MLVKVTINHTGTEDGFSARCFKQDEVLDVRESCGRDMIRRGYAIDPSAEEKNAYIKECLSVLLEKDYATHQTIRETSFAEAAKAASEAYEKTCLNIRLKMCSEAMDRIAREEKKQGVK